MNKSHLITTAVIVACMVAGSAVYTYNTTERTAVRAITQIHAGYRVMLQNAGFEQIKVIKQLRALFPKLSLTEAKNMVEGTPTIIVHSVSKEDAHYIKEVLESIGALVTVVAPVA